MPNVKNQPSIFYGCTELSYNRRNDEDSDPNTHAWMSSDGSYFADRFYRQIVVSKKDGDSRQGIVALPKDISQYSAVYIDPADPRNVRLLANNDEIRNSGLATCSRFATAQPPPVKNGKLSSPTDTSLPVTGGKRVELRGDKYWMEITEGKWEEVGKGPDLIWIGNSDIAYPVEGYSLKLGDGKCELAFQIKGKKYYTPIPFDVAETDKDESVGFTLYFNGDLPLIAVGNYKNRPTEQTKQNVFPDEAAHVVQERAANTTSIDAKIAVISELMKKIRGLVSPSEAHAFYSKIVMLSYDDQVEEARQFIARAEADKRKVEAARVMQEPAANTTSIDGKIAVISELMKKIRKLVSPSEAQAFYSKIVVLSYDDQVEEARQFIAKTEAGKRKVETARVMQEPVVDTTADRKKAETARVAQELAAAKKAQKAEEPKRPIQVAAPVIRPVIAAKVASNPRIDTEKKEDKEAVKNYFAALQRLNMLLEPYLTPDKTRGVKDWTKVNELYLRLGVAGNAPMVEKSYAVAEAQVQVVLFSEGQSEYSERELDQLIGTVSAKLEKGRDDLLIKKMDALKEFKKTISAKINAEAASKTAAEEKAKVERIEAEKKAMADAEKAAEGVSARKAAEAAAQQAALEAEANRLVALKDAEIAKKEKAEREEREKAEAKKATAAAFWSFKHSKEYRCALDMNCKGDHYGSIVASMDMLSKIDRTNLDGRNYVDYGELEWGLQQTKRIIDSTLKEQKKRRAPEAMISDMKEYNKYLYSRLVQDEAQKSNGVQYDFTTCDADVSRLKEVFKIFGNDIERIVVIIKAKDGNKLKGKIEAIAGQYRDKIRTVLVDRELGLKDVDSAQDRFDIHVFSNAVRPDKAGLDADVFYEIQTDDWRQIQEDKRAELQRTQEEQERNENEYKEQIALLSGIKLNSGFRAEVRSHDRAQSAARDKIILFKCPINQLGDFISELEKRKDAVKYTYFKINMKDKDDEDKRQIYEKLGGISGKLGKKLVKDLTSDDDKDLNRNYIFFLIVPMGTIIRSKEVDKIPANL